MTNLRAEDCFVIPATGPDLGNPTIDHAVSGGASAGCGGTPRSGSETTEGGDDPVRSGLEPFHLGLHVLDAAGADELHPVHPRADSTRGEPVHVADHVGAQQVDRLIPWSVTSDRREQSRDDDLIRGTI